MMDNLEKNLHIDEDKLSRERIVSELEDNFFVEASAGSGKTTSLVYRMVALIEKGVPVDKICTITFTKAAADEFFNRFQSLLSTRSILVEDESDNVLNEKTEQSVKLCQEALGNIDSCFLGTIDAFCNMIAHELPSELGIPSDSEVIDMDEYLSIVKEVNLAILRNDSHPLHNKAIRFKELIYPYEEALSTGVKSFLEMRHTKIIYDGSLVDLDMDVYFEEEKISLLEIIKDLIGLEDCYLPNKNGEKNVKYKYQTTLKSSYRILKGKSWNDCLTALKFALDAIKKMNGFSPKVIGQGIDEYLDIKEKIRSNSSIKFNEAFNSDIDKIKDKLNEYNYSIFCDYINNVSHVASDAFKKLGKFQFFDFLYYLNEAFKKSAKGNKELINHILERHSHFLLDESQDTNPLQTELFFHLTGTVDDEDWKKVKPKKGSLFIVGDPKQSIYSFRDANVSAYLNNKKIFEEENEVLLLTRNFRSNVRLRQWFNHTMNDLLNHDPEALEHIDIPISKEEIEKEEMPDEVIDGVYKYCVEGKDDGEYIAQLIVSLVGKKKIYSKNENRNSKDDPRKKERLIRYSDFMIVPRGTDATKIISALNKYHIPMTIEAQIPFKTCESLMVIKDLLYLLKSPQDINEFTNVIYGPLYQLDEKDVITLLNEGFNLNISHPFEISDPKLNEVIKELNNLYLETKDMSFSSTMLYILCDKKINIFNKISTHHLEYLYYLIQKIKEKEEDSSIKTVNELKLYIENFILGKDEQRTLRFKDKLERVKISNVHKVKGLQAPIVILARPIQSEKNPIKYVDYNELPPKTYFSKFVSKDGFIEQTIVETKKFDDQLLIWKGSAKAEKERLEYVAATRAESVLIVGSSSKIDKDESNPWEDLYSKVDDDFKNADLELEEVEPIELVAEDVSLGDFNINIKSHQSTVKYISPSQMRVNRINNNYDEIDDSNYTLKEEKDATFIGTLIHRLMELMISSINKYDINDIYRKIKNEYGFECESYQKALLNIATIIRSGGFNQKNSTLDNDILSTLLKAKRVWCEMPFSYLSKEGNIVNGIIDVLYLDQDDNYHIIDYKTNVENDVLVLEQEYEKQLTSYKFALKKIGIDADAHIYHIDIK